MDLITALEQHLPTLQPQIHLSAAGSTTAPAAWQQHPTIQQLLNLPRSQRARQIDALLRHDTPMMRVIGVFAMIAGQHRELLDFALTSRNDCDDALLHTLVIAAIGRLHLVEAFDEVADALANPQLFWVAVESLALLDDPRALALLNHAWRQPSDGWDRLDVVTIIGEVGGPSTVPLLIDVLEDPHEDFAPLHGFAAQALGLHGDQRALKPLLRALNNPNIAEKGRVLWGLAALGASEAFDDLVPFVHHADKLWWRGEALKALARSDARRAYPHVRNALLNNDSVFRGNVELFIATLQALSHIRHDDALDLLVDALRLRYGLNAVSGLDWTLPTFSDPVTDTPLAGVIIRGIAVCLDLEIFPDVRPETFSPDTLVRTLLTRLTNTLQRQDHPHADALHEVLQRL